jgi:hypothetical protein
MPIEEEYQDAARYVVCEKFDNLKEQPSSIKHLPRFYKEKASCNETVAESQ